MLLTAKEAKEVFKINDEKLLKFKTKPIIKKVGKRVLYDKDKLEQAIEGKEESENAEMYSTYNGQKVTFVSSIVKVHQKSKSAIIDKIKKLDAGKDYYKLSADECSMVGKSFGTARGIYLITIPGYLKMFNSDINPDYFSTLFNEEYQKGHEAEIKQKNNKFRKDGRIEKVFSYGGKRYSCYGHSEAEAEAKVKDMISKLSFNTLMEEPTSKLFDILAENQKIYKDILEKQNEQLDILLKLISALVQKAPEKTEEKEDAQDLKLTSPITSKEWYENINRLIEEIKQYTTLNKNIILSEAYKILNGQYGLCIEQYKKEYQEIVGKKPNTLSTVCWIENERNPATQGLLSGVLETILTQARENEERIKVEIGV